MNIKRAKEEIRNSIEAYLLKDEYGAYRIPSVAQRPLLLMGPPGIGKTQIVAQVAKECQVGLCAYTITHHTRQSAIGLPFISQKTYGGIPYSTTEYTMSEIVASIYDKIEKTGLSEGVLFIDEINCVSETLAPTMLQFLQAKTFGNHKIPEGWVIVAAGNPPEYNKSVREFDIVTLDRIKRINVEADFGVWKEYAYEQAFHPSVISYLNTKKQNLYQVETTVDGKLFATPRGWEDLSRLITVYETTGKPMDREVIFQYIQHPKISKDFANYLELYYKYQSDYQIDAILEGDMNPELFTKLQLAPFDERLSVVSLLLARLSEGFRKCYRKEQLVSALFDRLSDYKEQAAQAPETADAAELLAGIADRAEAEWLAKRDADLLTRRQDYTFRDLLAELSGYVQLLRAERLRGPQAAFERVRELFTGQTDEYSGLVDKAGEMLEKAFDFMEAAFRAGQEMVIFITELNTNYYSIRFLKEYDCKRYYQYNRQFLFGERNQEILARLDAAEQEMTESAISEHFKDSL